MLIILIYTPIDRDPAAKLTGWNILFLTNSNKCLFLKAIFPKYLVEKLAKVQMNLIKLFSIEN